MKYCVLFPQAENVHLIKDVGMIAYKLNKLYDYDSYVACYNNGDYPYLKNEVNGLKLDFINKKNNNDILNGIKYLKNNASTIDVLQLFHITLRTVFYAFAYKHYNKNGKIFLKLDCTEKLVKIISSMGIVRKKILHIFLNKIDIIGVEQEKLYEELRGLLDKNKLINIPNGIDYDRTNTYNNINYEKKEKVILHVGRIGSAEKGTDFIMEAFSKIENVKDSGWKLVFVGPVEKSFDEYKEEFFKRNPHLVENIIFKGAIYDRDELYEQYKKAKVFCLASKYESFGIALIEAASFGDAIISTDVGIAREIIKDNNGIIIKGNNIKDIREAMESVIKNEDLDNMCKNTEELCKKKYDWNVIVKELHEKISKLTNNQ